MSPITFAAGAVSLSGLPQQVQWLADALAKIHGSVHVTREKHGLHINLACPICLEKEGDCELRKRHLAVNADKACGTGIYKAYKTQQTNKTLDQQHVSMCMKCKRTFSINALKAWKTLENRGIKASTVGKVSVADNTAWLVKDARGNIIPGGPGTVVPIHELPPEHPARMYLELRGYKDLRGLYEQMRVSFCTDEWPEDPAKGRFYRKIHFKSGPQISYSPRNRIIFYCDIEGVQRGWQQRVIEHVVGDIKYYLHSATGQWIATERFSPEAGKFRLLPELEYENKEYSAPSKYRSSNGIERNSVLFGYDAAVRWNMQHRPGRAPVAFLAEGPLDACRIGPPGIAQIGKFLSDSQVEILARRFSVAVLVPDNDKAGQDTKEDSMRRLSSKMKTRLWELPSQYKDIGEMPDQEAKAKVQEILMLL